MAESSDNVDIQVETVTTSPEQVQQSLRVLEAAIADRFVLARILGMTHQGKRDVYGVLGYDDKITVRQYRERYARGGVAGRVVDAMAKAVWRGEGKIYEDENPDVETPFEAEWHTLNDQLRVWSTLQRSHILASLASFAVILLGAPGELSSPLVKGKPGDLLYLQPFGGGVVEQEEQRGMKTTTTDADVTVKDWDENVRSPRFGQPLTYQLKRTNMQSPGLTKPVHWTRVIHIPAPGFLDDAVYGPPALESVWNYLLDLDKVVGGGSEAFWLRANAGTHIDVDKATSLSVNKEEREAELANLREQADAYAHQMTRMMRTRGVNISQLGSDVADFKNPADVLLTLIAGTTGIPKRILTGSEMGQLASEQDRDNWNDQVKDCRTSYAHPNILRPFVERLIEYGYLSTPKQWDPQWPDLDALSDVERLDAAVKAASLNDHGELIITSEEIRETYLDLEPLDDAILAQHEEKQQAQTQPQVDQLAAALRKGGTVSIAVKS